MENKFKFYENVEIISPDPRDLEFYGKQGTVLGMVKENDGIWSYGVKFDHYDQIVRFAETDLHSAGTFRKYEDFYSGEVIKVIVDPETGEGKIKGE